MFNEIDASSFCEFLDSKRMNFSKSIDSKLTFYCYQNQLNSTQLFPGMSKINLKSLGIFFELTGQT
jgi:hypothetical protein